MRALLLAAGLGTRLQPLTNYLPKCLAPIHGRPLLDYWLEALLSHGIDHVLINTHYMAPIVQEYINKSTWMSKVTLINEKNLLGTGGTVLNNRDFFQDEAFLVAHADNLISFDMGKFIQKHSARPAGADITMMVFETPDPQSCGIVSLDSQGVVQAFHEKVDRPLGNLANGAIYIFEPSVIEWLSELDKTQIDLSTEVIPQYLGRICTLHNDVYHRDIGTMESWIQANHDFPNLTANNKNVMAWREVLASQKGCLANGIFAGISLT